MSFNPTTPNASQSPGLFPIQNNNNYNRLKAIINNDHVFNDTQNVNTDGIHRQMTMLARAHPVGPITDANAILYANVDGAGQTQLWFYNGTTDTQLTLPQMLLPIRVVGSATVATHATAVAYADPGFLWAGTGWGMVQNTTNFRFYNLLRAGANNTGSIDDNGSSSVVPSLSFSGNNLIITNNSSGTQILVWSLIINRIS